MKFSWKIIILFLHFYLTEECGFKIDDESIRTLKLIPFEILETAKVGEQIGKIPITITSNSTNSENKLSCSPEEIKCHLENESVVVTLAKDVVHYPDKSKITLSCNLQCKSEDNQDLEYLFHVKIKDVNNNHPTFGKKVYEFNVLELTPINKEVNSELITVHDDDFEMKNSQIVVSIINNDDGVFELMQHPSSAHNKKNFYIILKKRLNYNKKSCYELKLFAEDKGSPPLNGTADVILNITDEDDRDPEFKHFFYKVHMKFDKTEEGLIILEGKNNVLVNEVMQFRLDNVKPERIHAYDPDFGINQTVYYKIGESKWNKYFEINKEDGTLYLISFNIEMLEEEKINLPIIAYQADFEEKTGYACLTVFFTVNASVPYFIHQINILDKSLKDDVIYLMAADGKNLTYDTNENQYIYVNNSTGAIHLLDNASSLPKSFSVDFTVKTQFLHLSNNFQGNFRVVPREYKKSLFKKSIYNIELSKNSHKNDYLFEMSDEILDKNIHLNLSGEDVQYFDLLYKNDKIIIVLNEDFPVERENFTLVVDAIKENNKMILERDSTKLIFHVVEGNCQLKIFKKEIYIIDKHPDWKIGEQIYTVETNVPDTQFSIKDENEFFRINNTTGEISLKSKLDKCQRYELKVFGYVENPPRNDSTELIFDSDICIKKFRKFNKCVYEWNIEDPNKIEPLVLNDTEIFDENFKFSIISFNNKNDKLDKFEIDESGKLKIVKKLPKGQHFLKLQQQDKHYAKSSQNVKIKDVGNNEALIVIQFGKPEIIEEKKKVVFLHSTPFYKFFLPNAPLSDYNFEIKVISDGGVDEQIRIKNNSDIFSIDPVNNEIFPLKDISILENFQTVLTVEAINFVDEKLDIYIYQLHEENCLNISISTNISVLLSKSQIERNITGILQQQNNYQEMSFHILKYYLKDSNNNMKNYEIISTILHNKTLLTYKEMKDKFTDVQQQIQNSFGSFKLTSFLKEIRDKDENGNRYHFMMIIFGSLAAFLLIIIIISFIFSRLKKSKHSKSTKNEFINGKTKSIEQEFENQSLHSSNNPEAVIVEKSNRLDQVDQSAVNEENPSARNNKFYVNKAYDDRYDDIDLDQNEIKEANHSKSSKNYNEDQKNITNNYENLHSLNGETETNQIEFKAEQHKLKNLQNETELDSSNISESERHEIDENNIENDQNKEPMVIINKNENVLLKDEDEDQTESDDDDSEFKNRRFSHRDSLTRLASFSEHVQHQSSDDDDIPIEQGPKRSIVSFNDITEYIP